MMIPIANPTMIITGCVLIIPPVIRPREVANRPVNINQLVFNKSSLSFNVKF